MTNNPLVSIITPCYNDAHFIHLPINSVLDQPYGNYEMIIVNDGSTDKRTLDILGNIDHSKIRVVHKKNGGLPAARNFGINLSKGKYILPLDSDDQITSICLERSVRELENKPNIAMVYGDYMVFGDEDRVVRTGRFNRYRLLWNNYLCVCSMFRRSAWEVVGGYTEEMKGFEDWEYWIKLIESGFAFEKIDEIMFMYHRHSGSMWTRDKGKYKRLIAQIRSLHPRLYDENNMKELREELNVSRIQDLVYRIPLPWRYKLGKSFVRRFIKPFERYFL